MSPSQTSYRPARDYRVLLVPLRRSRGAHGADPDRVVYAAGGTALEAAEDAIARLAHSLRTTSDEVRLQYRIERVCKLADVP